MGWDQGPPAFPSPCCPIPCRWHGLHEAVSPRDPCRDTPPCPLRWQQAGCPRTRVPTHSGALAQLCFCPRISPVPGSPELLVRGITTCKSGSLMSLMKSSEGKHFSGELRIFISHTRNLTCRLVGSGNLSHEIVLLKAASSPAAFGNYLTHRLPLDRLPSVEMHLLTPKSALVPLLTASTAGAGVRQLPKDSLPPLQSPDPFAGAWNGAIPSLTPAGSAPAPLCQAGLAQLRQPWGGFSSTCCL